MSLLLGFLMLIVVAWVAFVAGYVHGRWDEFEKSLERVRKDTAMIREASDYIDRLERENRELMLARARR